MKGKGSKLITVDYCDDDMDDFLDTDECLTQNDNYTQDKALRSITPNLEISSSNMKKQNDSQKNYKIIDNSQAKVNSQTLQSKFFLFLYLIDERTYQSQKNESKINNYNKNIIVNLNTQDSHNNIQNHKTQQSTNESNFNTIDPQQNKQSCNSNITGQNFNSQQNFYATTDSKQSRNIPANNDDPEYEQDFHKAYEKLVKKVYNEQGQNILVSQEELAKIAYKQQLSIDEFNKRNQQSVEIKQQKAKILEEFMKQHEMQECTFKPQIYSKKEQQRNFEQFVKDQKNFEEQRAKKKQELKEQIEKQVLQQTQAQPKVNKKSARIVEEKKRKNNNDDQKENYDPLPVHQRLHQLHHEQLYKKQQKQQELNEQRGSRQLKKTKSTSNIAPQNPREKFQGMKIEEILQYEGLKKQQNIEQKKQQIQKEKEEQIMSTKPQIVTTKNTKYAASKFEKEFVNVCQNIMDESNDINNDTKVNYVKLGKLLTELGFLPLNIQPDAIERELQFDFWNLLKGEELKGIPIINIKKFLLAVQGITLDNYQTQCNTRNSDKDNNEISLSFDENGILKFSQQDTQKLFVKFKPLYINRIQFIGQQKKPIFLDQNCTFKPQISKTTEQLAIQRRAKLLNELTVDESNSNEQATIQDPNNVNLVQILLHPYHLDNQWKEEAKQILEQRELEQCTFRPQICKYESNLQKSKSHSSLQSATNATDRCQELYIKSKIHQKEKKDKSNQDYEYEKYKEECTFQPNISQTQKKVGGDIYSQCHSYYMQSEKSNNQNIKGYEETMQRMKKGRELKEKERILTSRNGKDESDLQPMYYGQNSNNYKGTFSNFTYIGGGGGAGGKENNRSIRSNHNLPPKVMKYSKSNEQLLKGNHNARGRNASNIDQCLKDNKNLTNLDQSTKILSHALANFNRTQKIQNIKNEVQQENKQAIISENPTTDNNSMTQKSEKQPLLYVDVNLGPGKQERIIVYDCDSAESLAEQFAQKHSLDNNMKQKLIQLLDGQIAGLLEKIDEEQNSVHSGDNNDYMI